MESLLVRSKDRGQPGVFASVTAKEVGWDFLNMAAYRLNKGDTWGGSTGDNEYVHVVLGGVCRIRTSQGNYEQVGRRPDVFSGMPYALYLSRHTDFEIEALTDGLEIASGW